MLAVCAAVLGAPTGKGRPLDSVLNSEAEGLLRKTEQVKTQIETLKGKIESLKQKGGEVCTDINLANGKLSKGSLGGLDKCCNVCEDDASKVCCPTKKCTDSKGNGGRKANKDGKGTYCPEENVKDVRARPAPLPPYTFVVPVPLRPAHPHAGSPRSPFVSDGVRG